MPAAYQGLVVRVYGGSTAGDGRQRWNDRWTACGRRFLQPWDWVHFWPQAVARGSIVTDGKDKADTADTGDQSDYGVPDTGETGNQADYGVPDTGETGNQADYGVPDTGETGASTETGDTGLGPQPDTGKPEPDTGGGAVPLPGTDTGKPEPDTGKAEPAPDTGKAEPAPDTGGGPLPLYGVPDTGS